MIYGKLEFGLGNQMFQYAFLKKLQHEYGMKAVLDISSGSAFGQYHARKPVFLLSKFNLDLSDVSFESDASVIEKAVGVRWKFIKGYEFVLKAIAKLLDSKDLFHFMQCITQRLLNKSGIYTMQYGPAPLYYNCKKKDIIFYGNFLSPTFFDDIGDLIKKEFQINTPINSENRAYLDKILDTESVCVHIRRGDFTVPRYAMLNVCQADYYQKAIDKMRELRGNVHFFVFSNDMEWVKDNIDFGNNVDYVEANSSSEPVEELRLMMNCKHFIIANSSFSWWAQYLSTNSEKVVIAPKYFRTVRRWNDIVSTSYRQPNWILIDNCEVSK